MTRSLGLSYGVDCDDGEGHDDGYDDEGDLQDFFNHLPALDCCKTLLFEETATIFLVMMVVVGMFGHENFFLYNVTRKAQISRKVFLQKPRNTLFEFCSSYGTFVLSVMSLSLRASSHAQVTSLTT